MKKAICLIILIAMIGAALFSCVGCASQDDGKLKIVVTIFPEYDWVMQVLGERAEEVNVTLLLDSGSDLHSYDPSPADLVAVAKADLFLYVGGESDDWVDDALKNKINKDMRVVNLLDELGSRARLEEIKEGMEHDEEEESDEEDLEYDEHVWLSLKNAEFYVNLIADELCALDGEHAEVYRTNAAAYVASLTALDLRYEQTVAASPRKTLLFGDRFPFLYMIKDYGLDYYAAFVGCSAETNASFETMKFLIDKANEEDVKVILKLENSSATIAEGIKSGSTKKNQQIKVLDSLQSATKKEYAAGRTYLNVMTSNLDVLASALAA